MRAGLTQSERRFALGYGIDELLARAPSHATWCGRVGPLLVGPFGNLLTLVSGMCRLIPTRAVRSARCACTSRCPGLCREPRAHQAVAAPWRQSPERGGAVRAQVCWCVHLIGSTSATRKSAPRRCAALLSSHAHGECCNTPPVQLVGGGRGSAYCLMPSSCYPARCRSVLRNKQPPCVCHLARAVCSAQRDRGVVRQHTHKRGGGGLAEAGLAVAGMRGLLQRL